jgi:hypothetical protein
MPPSWDQVEFCSMISFLAEKAAGRRSNTVAGKKTCWPKACWRLARSTSTACSTDAFYMSVA